MWVKFEGHKSWDGTGVKNVFFSAMDKRYDDLNHFIRLRIWI